MTNAEVLHFVELEIASRYRTLDDTVRGDWVRAVWKCGDLETAQQIIRKLVEDPDASLSIKQFYAQLRARRVRGANTNRESPVYNPFIMCIEAPVDHPGWKGREWLVWAGPVGRAGESFRTGCRADKLYVGSWANGIAKEYEAVHGGQWCGVVREADESPYDGSATVQQRLADAERMIVDGPDTPGKRWLLDHRGKDPVEALAASLPSIPPAPKAVCASREMIDRLRGSPPAAIGGGPKRFDPNDPELRDECSPDPIR